MAAALFPTVLSKTLTSADNAQTLAGLALGKTSIVLCTLTQNVTLNGLAATGGNVDGMVVTLQNVTGSFQLSVAHESAGTAANSFRNAGLAGVTTATGYGAVTFRYLASLSRWIHIATT